jgi:hypothetical protein
MATPRDDNRRYILSLWIPALAICAVVGFLTIAALRSGDPARIFPVVIGIVLTSALFLVTRWRQKRRVARLWQSADPEQILKSFSTSLQRIPHGSFFAAANTATVLSLYGRFDEAERALAAVSWESVPPFVRAQEAAARAALAYASGSVAVGLDHAVVATQQASLNIAAPGATTSELAFRTYRNLGLALSGRATETTGQELRTALAKLPLLGQLLAAWGLAAIGKSGGSANQFQEMCAFIRANAPHATALLHRSGAG